MNKDLIAKLPFIISGTERKEGMWLGDLSVAAEPP